MGDLFDPALPVGSAGDFKKLREGYRRGRLRAQVSPGARAGSESAGRAHGPLRPARGRGRWRLRGGAVGRPGGRPGVRQRCEPRSFPLTRRAERRAGPGAASLPPPPPLQDAQSQRGGWADGSPAERTQGRGAGAYPAGTQVASVSRASSRIAGERRGAAGPAGRDLGEGASRAGGCALRPLPLASSPPAPGRGRAGSAPACARPAGVREGEAERREWQVFRSPPPRRRRYPQEVAEPRAGCGWRLSGDWRLWRGDGVRASTGVTF